MLADQRHLDERRFTSHGDFRIFLEESFSLWPSQVQKALKLVALHGILDPITAAPIAAAQLEVVGPNFRESLVHEGLLSRHRAVLLVLQRLIDAARLPQSDQLELYCPEAITPFARALRERFPNVVTSEYLPDPDHPLRTEVAHQDLCALSLASASLDLVICNEIFEHLYDLPTALSEIARVLRPGGVLLSTFPFAYDSHASLQKAIHHHDVEPEQLGEAEFHGNPVDAGRSLVYQVPGWEILDQLRGDGFSDPAIHWIAAPSYGVIGGELPGVLVLVATR